MQSYRTSFYVQQIKPLLSPILSAPAGSRLIWLPAYGSIAALAMVAVARGWLPCYLLPLQSLVIGLAFAGLMFLGHETAHGAVVRGRWTWMKPVVATACFAPLVVSPRLWTVWHNRMHHGHANHLDVDPDMYPSLAVYRANRTARFVTDHFAPGGGRWTGALALIVGFSVQAAEVLRSARTRVRMSAKDHRLAVVETACFVMLWAALAYAIGFVPFLFAYVLPVVVANAIVMSFILTNHALCAATETNDPLLGALSVTAPRWIEWLTLGFGYHVEHHLFPSASARHARQIRAAITAAWPERYQSMPLVVALARLFRTGRVYRDATTLVDPRTHGEWSTLVPSTAPTPGWRDRHCVLGAARCR